MTTAAAALAAYQSDADLRAARGRLGEALPSEGWLADYLAAVTPLTDAPVEFHLASGLAALAGAVGNRMHVESWGQTVYPHLWAVLVAPSSFWRKSTSINTAEGILRAAVPASAMPSDFSREKLLTILSENPAGLLTIKEFGGFLAVLGASYMQGTKEVLTDLYDGPDLFTRALRKDVIEIRRPALSILAATTLDWLESRITEGDLRGGFLARFLFVTAKHKASAKGLTGGIDPGAKAKLVSDLAMLGQLPDVAELNERLGHTRLAPGVASLLNDWMAGWEDEVGRTHHRSDLSGFAVRLQTYALKFAMLYRASAVAGSDPEATREIDEASLRQAIAYCRVLWANVAALIDDDMAVTEAARELRRLRGIVGSGIARSEALRKSKLKVRDFDGYVATLVAGHEIVQERRKPSEIGLERQRDRELEWLAPAPSLNGHSGWKTTLGFSSESGSPDLIQFPGTEGEPEGTVTRNDNGNGNSDDLNRESSNSSTSLSSLYSDDDGAHTRVGRASGNGNRKRSRPTSSSKPDDPMDLL